MYRELLRCPVGDQLGITFFVASVPGELLIEEHDARRAFYHCLKDIAS